MKSLLLPILLLLSFICNARTDSTSAPSPKPGRKGSFSFYWGYNRAKFSSSDIHFHGPDYDFTLYDVKASDRPSPFTLKGYFSPSRIWIPQYNFRLGYFLTNNFHISFGMDHMKYVVDHDQQVLISGVVAAEASPRYAGTYLNDTVTLTRDFLTFEHTDGLNLASFEFEYLQPIKKFFRGNIGINANFGAGGVWMITRTDVRVFEDGINNDFHIAGFTMSAKAGLRVDIWKYFFVSGDVKAGYVHLPWVLIKNSAPEGADHNFTFMEYTFNVGGYFRLWKAKK